MQTLTLTGNEGQIDAAMLAAPEKHKLRLHVFRNKAGLLQLNYRLPGEVFSACQHESLTAIGAEPDQVFQALADDFAIFMND